MRRLLVLALGVALTACELLVGIKDKSDQDGGGADGATKLDVSVGGDSSTQDLDLPCAQQPPFLFCEDFDSDVDAGENWKWDNSLGSGSVELTTANSPTTPPQAVAFVNPTQASTYAQLGKDLGNLTTGFRLAFDLLLLNTDQASLPQSCVAQVYVASVHIDMLVGPGATCEVQEWQNQANGKMLASENVPCPPLGAWTRMVLAYDATAGVTYIEGGNAVAANGTFAVGAPGDTTLVVGAVYVNPPGAAAFQADIDTVVVRGQ
jgi:hypothetical protein